MGRLRERLSCNAGRMASIFGLGSFAAGIAVMGLNDTGREMALHWESIGTVAEAHAVPAEDYAYTAVAEGLLGVGAVVMAGRAAVATVAHFRRHDYVDPLAGSASHLAYKGYFHPSDEDRSLPPPAAPWTPQRRRDQLPPPGAS